MESGEKRILAELDQSNLALAAALSQRKNLQQEFDDTKQSLDTKLTAALGEKSEIEKNNTKKLNDVNFDLFLNSEYIKAFERANDLLFS